MDGDLDLDDIRSKLLRMTTLAEKARVAGSHVHELAKTIEDVETSIKSIENEINKRSNPEDYEGLLPTLRLGLIKLKKEIAYITEKMIQDSVEIKKEERKIDKEIGKIIKELEK